MKFTDDTDRDSIGCPELTEEQTRDLQRQLAAALIRNDPVRTVANTVMAVVGRAASRH